METEQQLRGEPRMDTPKPVGENIRSDARMDALQFANGNMRVDTRMDGPQFGSGNMRMDARSNAPQAMGMNMGMDASQQAKPRQRLVEFRKGLFGVNAREVYEYIDLLNTNLNKAHEVYEEKLAEMKSSNELLSYERSNQDEKLRQFTKNYEALTAERNELKKALDSRQDMADELQRVKQENVQFQERIDKCAQIENDNLLLKRQLAELQANTQMQGQQQAKLQDEIESLKQKNKEILQTGVEERTQLEAEYEAKILNFKQLLQMHRYTLGQSRELLGKLIKQFDESCEYADRMRAD